MEKRFSKIFSIVVYAFLALWMGACKSEPIRLPELSGHRGADCIAPENTLASADSCIKYKIDFMECDICISKDSVFYLLHDSTFDRTTNGTGLIREWLSADIDTLDAGSWFGEKFSGQCVPRLDVLLRKAKQNGLEADARLSYGRLWTVAGSGSQGRNVRELYIYFLVGQGGKSFSPSGS